MSQHTLYNIIHAKIPSTQIKTSEALCKLILVILWSSEGRVLPIKKIAQISQCGERTAYRALKNLRDIGWVKSQRFGEGSVWMLTDLVKYPSLRIEE